MSTFRNFEQEVLRLLLKSVLHQEILNAVLEESSTESYEYTGCGYFLTIKSLHLPWDRIVADEPLVTGVAGDVQAGFIVFLENQELTLECHTWGAVDVPSDFRDRNVVVETCERRIVAHS